MRRQSSTGPAFQTVDRPRLRARLRELLGSHRAVLLVGGAGSGKTVLARQLADAWDGPVAWVEAACSHLDPHRLVADIVGAVGGSNTPIDLGAANQGEPSLDDIAADAAMALDGERVLLVMDCCEVIARRPALTALAVFVDYLPADAHVLMVSREELGGPFSRMLLQGDIGRMTGDELELDGEETARLLDELDVVGDRESIVVDAAGWIAAVSFLAHRAEGPGPVPAGLSDYLLSSVLDRCEPGERCLLLRSSVARSLSRDTVIALCGPETVADYERLRARQLPAIATTEHEIVLHGLFRAFLQERLLVELPGEVDELRRRHAQLLLDSGDHEAAVEEFLLIGDRERAAEAAERALPTLIERAAWQTIRHWLGEVGSAEIDRRPLLLSAHLRSLYGLRAFAEARSVVCRLADAGRTNEVVACDPGVVPYLGLPYHWEPLRALDLVNQHEGDFRTEAVRYELGVLSGSAPVTPPTGVDWSDMEGIMSYGLLMQGRLDQLLAMLPSEIEWARSGFYRTPHPLLGLVWRGELERARGRLDSVPREIRSLSQVDQWHFHEAWLLWAENDVSGMLSAAEAAIDASRDVQRGAESCCQVVLGLALIELERVDEAVAILSESIAESRASGLVAYVEWGQTFLGLALLAQGKPVEATRVLREAFDGMTASDRRLMLPLTGLYLSEAISEVGDEEAARRAASAAFDESVHSSTEFILARGVRHVPAVLERRLAEDPHSRWRRLLASRQASVDMPGIVVTGVAPRRVFIEIRTFGADTDILADGRSIGARRIKLLELATLLALHPEGLPREVVQRRLFPDADPQRSGNYFRQVLHKLRQLTGVCLTSRPDDLVSWPRDMHVETTDLRLEQIVERARDRPPFERLEAFMSAIQMMSGAFLRDSDLEWADARRMELDLLRSQVGLESAELALELGEHDLARTLALNVIAADPYVESAYRVLMRAEAFASPNTVVATYQRLCLALEQVGAEPMRETELLLHEIRS